MPAAPIPARLVSQPIAAHRPWSGKSLGNVHWSFWAIGTVALIWNVMGAINFIAQMNPDMLAAFRESERAIIENRPAWATGIFAVAVFGG